MKKEEKYFGKVISIRRNEIHLHSAGKEVICVIKKSLFKNILNQKNIITVGDNVVFNEAFQIISIDTRSTLLERVDPLNKRKKQLIGANIDRVYITFSMHSPDINIAMLDRYIMAARSGGIEPVVVLNKIDLAEAKQVDELLNLYQSLGIETHKVSYLDNSGMEALIASLCNKTSIFCGPSGVGKTSIINTITGKNLKIGEVSAKIQKGKHTTTYSSLFPLNDNTFIIDTPGIASFNLYVLTLTSILEYFSDLNTLGACRFNNCTHSHEPRCMVKEANKQNLISPLRFESFQATLAALTCI